MNILANLFLSWNHCKVEDLCCPSVKVLVGLASFPEGNVSLQSRQ